MLRDIYNSYRASRESTLLNESIMYNCAICVCTHFYWFKLFVSHSLISRQLDSVMHSNSMLFARYGFFFCHGIAYLLLYRTNAMDSPGFFRSLFIWVKMLNVDVIWLMHTIYTVSKIYPNQNQWKLFWAFLLSWTREIIKKLFILYFLFLDFFLLMSSLAWCPCAHL